MQPFLKTFVRKANVHFTLVLRCKMPPASCRSLGFLAAHAAAADEYSPGALSLKQAARLSLCCQEFSFYLPILKAARVKEQLFCARVYHCCMLELAHLDFFTVCQKRILQEVLRCNVWLTVFLPNRLAGLFAIPIRNKLL